MTAIAVTTDVTTMLGAVITARPWDRGSELAAQRGQVVAVEPAAVDMEAYCLVWFPARGGLRDEGAVQAILTRKIVVVQELGQRSRNSLRAYLRSVREEEVQDVRDFRACTMAVDRQLELRSHATGNGIG
jgi:hypothetical protein